MDMLATRTTWLAIAIFFITVVGTKILRWKSNVHLLSTRPPPPVVNVLAFLPSVINKGLGVTINDLYTKLGSVFTINLFGPKITLLVGPEVSTHFFQGLESEISARKFMEVTIPIFGQEAFYGVDTATCSEQINFIVDVLKPSNLWSLVDPMIQEVETYFAKWGQDGIVDLKHELEYVLMFISSRCLLGYEVRDMMLEEVYSLFHDLGKKIEKEDYLRPLHQRDACGLFIKESKQIVRKNNPRFRTSCG